MKKMIFIAMGVVLGVGAVWADDLTTGTTINATTIAASAMLSPGRYVVTVSPSYNSAMAGRLENAVGKLQGLEAVTSHAEDSTVRFKVKNGAQVSVAEIEKAVTDADAGSVMSEPILEHSMTANPGL